LLSLENTSLARAFLLGLTTGAIYFSGTLYWITRVMVVYGGLQPWVGVLVNALLIAYLALFPGLFAVVVRRIVARFGPLALMAAPLVWVATELGRTYVFGGFPWVLLGYSQASVLPIAQLASVFGVYGVSALVSGVSAGLAVFGLSVGRRPADAGLRARYVPLLALLALVAAIAVWGSARVSAADWTRAGQPVRVGLIQGNVDQAQKWDPARAMAIFGEYLRMTRQAIADGAQVVIWPESSTPFFFEEDRPGAEQVRAIARQSGVPILLGSDQIDHGPPEKYYNSAFLVRADGTTAGAYRKIHLVPFGEYVPLRKLLFFAERLVQAIPGDFSPGDSAVLLPVNGHLVSTAICYEIVYPALVRTFVAGGSELLTTITNDAWFGRTAAPSQHFAQASMRAIENGRYLVRSANTGISGVVDPYGRVVARSRIFEQAVIVSQARFLQTSTFYARHGDVFAYASVVASVAMLVFAPASRRRM
jgi:apolipoprotein N-acyltransferase